MKICSTALQKVISEAILINYPLHFFNGKWKGVVMLWILHNFIICSLPPFRLSLIPLFLSYDHEQFINSNCLKGEGRGRVLQDFLTSNEIAELNYFVCVCLTESFMGSEQHIQSLFFPPSWRGHPPLLYRHQTLTFLDNRMVQDPQSRCLLHTLLKPNSITPLLHLI